MRAGIFPGKGFGTQIAYAVIWDQEPCERRRRGGPGSHPCPVEKPPAGMLTFFKRRLDYPYLSAARGRISQIRGRVHHQTCFKEVWQDDPI